MADQTDPQAGTVTDRARQAGEDTAPPVAAPVAQAVGTVTERSRTEGDVVTATDEDTAPDDAYPRLTDEYVAGQTVEELHDLVRQHPNLTEAVVAIEKRGKDRKGVTDLADSE